jgi:hypothetical protein
MRAYFLSSRLILRENIRVMFSDLILGERVLITA